MQTVTFAHLWVDGAWQTDVAVDIDGGRVLALRSGRAPARGAAPRGAPAGDAMAGSATAGDMRSGYVHGLTLPGLADAHCHAFQRLLPAWTQRARASREQGVLHEDFWTWREAMYVAAANLGPQELEAVAARCYLELLRGGYTAVAEFLYLHRLPQGTAPERRRGLAAGGARAAQLNADVAIVSAARRAGIRLMLLPALYQHADFGGAPVTAGQAPFERSVQQFLQDWEELKRRYPGDDADRGVGAATNAGDTDVDAGDVDAGDVDAGDANGAVTLGVAFHSLRAVDVSTVAEVAKQLATDQSCRAVHIHVAEQPAEVIASIAHHGRRPVALLAERDLLGPRWALVHGIHTTAAELKQVALSGATLVACPSTEADLGDGYVDLAHYLASGGQLAIGSDSNIGRSAYAELRMLEWGLRQRQGRRNVLTSAAEPAVADRLLRAVRAGGWRAFGQPQAGAPGASADFVTFDADEGDWPLVPPENYLSALVFDAAAPQARDVMVAGHWAIRRGVHVQQAQIERRYRAALMRLQPTLRQALARHEGK